MIKQKSRKVINTVFYPGLIGTDPDYLNAIALDWLVAEMTRIGG
jgi:hypothetical protein